MSNDDCIDSNEYRGICEFETILLGRARWRTVMKIVGRHPGSLKEGTLTDITFLNDTTLLTAMDIAKETRLSERRVRELIATGALPSVRLPGVRAVRVPARALAAWLGVRADGNKTE